MARYVYIDLDGEKTDTEAVSCAKSHYSTLMPETGGESPSNNYGDVLVLKDFSEEEEVGDTGATQYSVSTILSYFVRVFRRQSLHANDRQIVLSESDVNLAVKLCYFNIHKKADSAVDQAMIDAANSTCDRFIRHKLGATDSSEQDLQALTTEYSEFMTHCNTADLADVIARVKEHFSTPGTITETGNAEGPARTPEIFILRSKPQTTIQRTMADCLCGSGRTFLVRQGESIVEVPGEEAVSEALGGGCPLDEISGTPSSRPCPPSPESFDEKYILSVMVGYLRLLINTRDEMALATTFNQPQRGLDHASFHCIKKLASFKGMPMCQTAMSYIRKVQLNNGKASSGEDSRDAAGASSDLEAALAEYTKCLECWDGHMCSLINILGDETDPGRAGRKVVVAVRNLLTKTRDATLRKAPVERVTDKVRKYIAFRHSLGSSFEHLRIQRPVDLLREVVDHFSTWSTAPPVANGNFWEISETPTRNVLVAFRSPAVLDENSLTSPVSTKPQPMVKPMKLSAPSPSSIRVGSDPAECGSPLTSRKQKELKAQLKERKRKVSNENVPSESPSSTPKRRATKKDRDVEAILESTGNLEKPLEKKPDVVKEEEELSKRKAKKSRSSGKENILVDTKKAATRPKKQKTIPLLKGQKKMMDFFRPAF